MVIYVRTIRDRTNRNIFWTAIRQEEKVMYMFAQLGNVFVQSRRSRLWWLSAFLTHLGSTYCDVSFVPVAFPFCYQRSEFLSPEAVR